MGCVMFSSCVIVKVLATDALDIIFAFTVRKWIKDHPRPLYSFLSEMSRLGAMLMAQWVKMFSVQA